MTDLRFAGPDRELAGTLAVPDDPGPHPAALLLPGSGPIDRDSNHRRLRIGVTAQLAGVVLLACPARPGDALLRRQAERLPASLPAPVRGLLRTDLVKKVARNHDRVRRTTGDEARIGGVRINARWTREFLDHDPSADLARLTVPVLAVTGEKDLQVDPDDLERIAALVPGGAETWRAPGLSHLLRAQPGPATMRTYRRDVRAPIDPALVARVTDWLARH